MRVVTDTMKVIRKKIAENKGSDEQIDGFLLGGVGEYFDDFDVQISKFDRRIRKDREHWTEKKKHFEQTSVDDLL